MNIDKDSIFAVLKLINNPGTPEDIVSSGCVTNIQIFGDQIDINLSISNPSLQARKKLEVEIIKSIHSKMNVKLKVNVFIKVLMPKKSFDKKITGGFKTTKEGFKIKIYWFDRKINV